jgi:exonuclease III
MSTKTWYVLSWNVRGINSDKKWDAIRDHVMSCNCDIVCLQETKKQFFDIMFIKKICPSSFDAFEYIPSVGASGGSIIIWKSNLFLAVKSLRMIMYVFEFHQTIIMNLGFSLTFMLLVLLLEKEISYSGSKISICLALLIG